MKRYTFLFINALLFFNAFNIFCLDYKEWILKSRRLDNPEITQILLTAELETQLIICKALGQRQDLAMDDLITTMLDSKIPALKNELLLEIILQSLLTTDYENEKIELWLQLNPFAFSALVKNLICFKNANLKIHIIHILRFAESQANVKSYLMSEAQNILSAVKNQNGYLTSYQKKELKEILVTIAWWEDKDFSEFCVSVNEICNDKELVNKARQLLKSFSKN
jgi:hypothetical protein